jgi:hypothetical protein
VKLTGKHLVLAAALFATSALAVNVGIQTIAQWFKGGIWVGTTAATSDTNKIIDSRGTCFSYDFPAFTAGGAGQAGGHLDGPTFALTGTAPGDVCFVTSDRSEWDAGFPIGLVPRCRVPSAGFVHLLADYMVDDAGTTDPVDAGYCVRTFGHILR